ncbi:MAG TPA: tail fiber domain-containing protein [Gemmatimonadaceae bacterium]|nr:tail fiber domain-containing protein [Gemmatimonadaceae bacterium]
MKKLFLRSILVIAASASTAFAQSDSAFAVSKSGVNLLRLNTDGAFVVRGTQDVGLIPATGAGPRLMWFPTKYAFRAGKVDSFGAAYWDLASIGYGSVSLGENSRASGDHSFAANLATTASGSESVALGNNGTASADRAFAFNGTASGVGAVAIGSGAQATNDDALAMGPSSIAGGLASIVIGPSIANGSFGVAIGLQNSASGNFSVAIGKNARTANRQGSIVLGDGCAGFSSDSVYPTANNQFVARGCGGIKMYTSQNLSTGVEVAAGGGSWSSLSDRNAKENFTALDGEEILKRLRKVPVSSWNYKTQPSEIRHIGPMAQDFFAAFKVGESERLINSLDIDGVNLAGVRALDTRTAKQQAQIEKLERSNAELKKQNEELLKRLEKLEAKLR